MFLFSNSFENSGFTKSFVKLSFFSFSPKSVGEINQKSKGRLPYEGQGGWWGEYIGVDYS